MKQQILELIAGGELELAKALIESQGIEFDVKKECDKYSKANPFIEEWRLSPCWGINNRCSVDYLAIRGEGQYLRFFNSEFEVLQFALTWKGGRQ